MQQIHEQILRQRFLKSYVLSLIKNSYKPEEKKEFVAEKMESQQKEEPLIPSIKIQSTPRPQTTRPPFPATYQKKIQQTKPLAKISLPEPPSPVINAKLGAIKLGKITQILMDPAVLSVECPGPGKNIIVNRSGQIQSSETVLTKKEIDEIMKEISEKTKIPIIPGLFKAAIQDLTVTAVISNYVGSRFIVQKRGPGF